MSPSVFSPTLTASSSSTSGFRSQSNTEVENMVDLDINMITGENENETLPGDFSDIFNFDEYDNGEMSSHSHSPNTISPNHTPSPLPVLGASPYAISSPSYDFFNLPNENMDFSFDYMMEEKANGDAGPAAMGYDNNVVPLQDIKIKEEPSLDYGFSAATAITRSSLSPPVVPLAAVPAPLPATTAPASIPLLSFDGLPADQQIALQQLMANILNYQKSFGMGLVDPAAAVVPAQTTIKPSELFGISPKTTITSSTTSSYTTPAIDIPATQQTPVNLAEVEHHAYSHEEPLKSIEPHEARAAAIVQTLPAIAEATQRSARQASTYSSIGDDLDEKLDRLAPISEIFSAGKGKGGKKGGGMSSVVKQSDEEFDDDDSWRPSPEEYKKLSSKEKRQLRNKLSARAFRTRRKDYIGTLEGHIRDRDSVIDAIRSELTNSRTENQDLRRELNALKASTMAILHPESASKVSQSPAMLNALSMTSLAGASSLPPVIPASPQQIKRSSTPTYPINVRKDLPSSGARYDASAPSSSSRGFWGGNGNDNIFGGGGSTICHTLLTPDIVVPPPPPSYYSSTSLPLSLRSISDLPRVNLNPLLNSSSSSSSPPSTTSTPFTLEFNKSHSLSSGVNGTERDLGATFSEWSENTPFSLRSMDSYRIQMWSRLAREAQSDKLGLTGELRPKFYVDSGSKVDSTSSSISSSTSTPSTEITSSASSPASSSINPPSPAQLANIASTHISSKLAGAFWSAFSSSSTGKLDTNKLTDVVTGKSHLQVVSTSSSPTLQESNAAAAHSTTTSSTSSTTTSTSTSTSSTTYNEKSGLEKEGDEAEALVNALSGLRLQAGQGFNHNLNHSLRTLEVARTLGVRENPLGALTGFLKLATTVNVCPCPTRA